MTTNTWAKKAPGDMTLEELQSAKEVMQSDFDTLQQELGWRNAANTALNTEILKRFAMQNTPGFISPEALPQYPTDQVASTYAPGSSAPPAQ